MEKLTKSEVASSQDLELPKNVTPSARVTVTVRGTGTAFGIADVAGS
jgi:hypothetical protein